MREKLVEIRDISVQYDGKLALESVSLDIFDDDYIGVIGPNGGGKTTLIKSILRLVHLSSGVITLCDKSLKIGYLPQINTVDIQFPASVEDLVLTGLQGEKRFWQRYSKSERDLAKEQLDKTGILHLAKKQIGTLSGGELQRALLCRALISNPKLLILDEPTTFVDNKFEKEFYGILKTLNERIAILMVSHDLGTICSSVRSIACVNRTLHYHPSNVISAEQLELYDCPIQLIEHGKIPHTILNKHSER